MTSESSTAGPHAWKPVPTWVQVALSCAALLAILFARRPEMFTNPQLWAEDGPEFFVAADTQGIRALITPLAGYHHFLLRLTAAAASPAPAIWIPTIYFAVSIGVLLVLASAVFSPRIELPWKPALAICLALVPHTGEAVGNLTNLQWVLALGLVWLLLARDAGTPREHFTDVIAAAVLGLTGVFSALLAPLFFVRAIHRRTVASVIVAVIVGLTGALQAWTVLHSPVPVTNETKLTATVAFEISGLRLPGCLFLPHWFAAGLPRTLWLFVGVATMLGLAITAAIPGRHWWTRLALAGSAAVLMAATMYRFRHGEYPALFAPHLGDRYFFLPRVCCLWMIVWAASRTSWTRSVAFAACGLVFVASGSAWRYEALPDRGWAEYAARLDSGEAVENIPINPGSFRFSHPGRQSR